MSKRHFYAWAALFLVLLFGGTAVLLRSAPQTNAMPLAHLVNPDGTLNLDTGYTGTIDPTGWEMTLDENGRPTFAPAAITDTGAWDTAYGAPGTGLASSGDHGVYALAADSQGNLYIGGDFTIAGDQDARNLAMWDGSAWHPVGLGTSSAVRALAVDSNDHLYVGGDFIYVTDSGGTDLYAYRIAKWDGSSWGLLGDDAGSGGNGLNNNVYALTVDASDNLYIGGQFTTAYNASGSSVSVNYIAKWDGSSWSALGADSGAVGNGVNHIVNALALDGNLLYVGGAFTTAYNSSVSSLDTNYIAAWDTDGSVWSALGAGSGATGNGVNNAVRALAIAPNGDLYLGGNFTIAYDDVGSDVPTRYLAHWDGAAWDSGPVSDGVDYIVDALAFDGDQLIFGGSFTHLMMDNSDANRVASFDTTTETWGLLGADQNGGIASTPVRGNGVNAGVVTALLVHNGSVYLGGGDQIVQGPFRAYNSQTSAVGFDAIARWDGSWHALSNAQTQGANSRGASGGAAVRAMALDSQGNLYVGGLFSAIGNLSANGLARWDGSAWHVVGGDSGDKGNGVDGSVYALAVDSADNLYVGGGFYYAFSDSTSGTGVSANQIAKWDGSTWTALGAGSGLSDNGLNSTVYALAVDANDNLAVGGAFTTAYNDTGNHVSANYVVLWNGTSWAALGADSGGSGNGVSHAVQALLWQGGNLYVGGAFTTAYNSSVSNVTANRIALWDGSSWAMLGGGLNGVVYALALDGTDLYVGGSFTQADGVDANKVARWDGAVWSPLGAGSGVTGNGLNEAVYALNLSADGSLLLVGGAFTAAYNDVGSSVAANRLAAWDFNASAWSAFGNGLDGTVFGVQSVAGDVWTGGQFRHADNYPSTFVARWLSDALVADVAVSKTAVPTTLTVGETAVYTLTISNAGPISSTNVVLTDTLSLSAQMVISPTTSQGACTAVANPLWIIQCDLGDLQVSNVVTVSYAVAPDASGSLVNTVLAAGETADPDINNNVAQVTVTVEEIPPTPTATPQPSSLSLSRSVLGSTGSVGTGTSLRLNSTLGQSSPISGVEGSMRTLGSGYWGATLPILRMPGGDSLNWQAIDLTFPPLPPGSTVWLIPQVGAVDNLDENSAAAGISFHVEVYDDGGTPLTNFTEPYTVTVNYEDNDWQSAGIVDEATLTLVYWDEGEATWQDTHPCSGCVLDTADNQLITLLDHATEFAVVGQTASGETVFLPVVIRP
ncbi:MAG: DUF11 domain-containing protein [Ardenticatenaceae bacterium]|nr:DUF11 domain-containing protein [Ardenticatenaceae bacterium]MCB9005675.1 DUF11 domain-containing protein [Ardenticatenaceae bacterium]